MEVHSHTHTPRKKWSHYLWEFLMLFLAVFCGFLAENIREHSVERHREKEYINSLVSDLQYDTLKFQQTVAKVRHKVPYYDSVLAFLRTPFQFNYKLPFKYYIQTNLERIYNPEEPTIAQLKNSGNLRLIEDKLLLDSILIYDSHITGPFRNQTNYVVEYNKRLIQAQERFFDQTNFNQFLNDQLNEIDPAGDPDYSLLLTITDKEKLNELNSLLIGAKASDVFYIGHLENMKDEASKLIALLKREYHIK